MLDSVQNSLHSLPLLDSKEIQSGEVYGSGARLVASYSVGNDVGRLRPNIAFFDVQFSLSLLMLVLLSIVFLSFRKKISSSLDSLLNFRKFWNYRRPQGGTNPLFIASLLLFSVLSLALFFAEVSYHVVPVLSETSSFLFLFIAICGMVAGFFLLRIFVCWLIGLISNEKQLFSDIIHSQVLFFAAMGFAIAPIILLKNFCVEAFTMSLFILLCALLLLIFVLYFFRTIRIFMQENNSIFFWILYFCTIEILPIILTIKFLEEIQ
jgi:hypothetical protein